MRGLDLRTRVVAAVALIAIVQVVVAIVVVTTTEANMLDQIDSRLQAASSPERDDAFVPGDFLPDDRDDGDEGDGDQGADGVGIGGAIQPRPGSPRLDDVRLRPERLGDTYEGMLRSDGTVLTFFAPNTTGQELSVPAVDLATAASERGPFTADSVGGEVDYRVVATPSGGGEFFLRAIPLTSVDATVSRLTTVLIATVAVVSAILAAVAWWVLRLGIAPIKRMTASATAIAAGDLSERVEDTEARTEAGELGRALNTMLGQIETSFEERLEAEQKLRQFIADASHELRTPVATIRGYAELYRMGGLDDRQALDDAMRRTEQESTRMSRLIADLLDLAKLDRDPSLNERDVDLVVLVADTCADAQATYPDRSITYDRAAEPVVVRGDEDLLRQVLANVVTNALVHTDPPAQVSVVVRSEGPKAIITVTDTGRGMEPEVASRITERFFRADTSRSRMRGGSGLGLAIARSAVEAHDGRVVVDSAVGIGTTVTIELPAPA